MSSATALRPETIDSLADAVFPAMAMLAGMKLDLFTPLRDGSLTTEEIAGQIGVPSRQLGPLLYALVEANLLTVDNGSFANTDEAAQYLVVGAPRYLGSRHLLLLRQWSGLLKTAESITSDSPQASLDFSALPPQELEDVYAGNYAAALAAGTILADRFDLSSHRSMVDVAGGSGGLAIGITQACAEIQATVVDLSSTIPITQGFVDAASASQRIEIKSGDVVESELPGTYDVAVMRNIIQVLSADHAQKALLHVNKSLQAGGTLFIMGTILDDSRLGPSFAVKSNLNFLNIYNDGRAYTEGEYRKWLEEAGFVFLERVVVANGTSIIKAVKN